MPGEFVVALVLLDRRVKPVALGGHDRIHLGEVATGPRRRIGEVRTLVPADDLAVPDDLRDLVDEGETASAFRRELPEPGHAVDVRLLFGDLAGHEVLYDRIRTRPAEVDAVVLGDAHAVPQQVGRPQGVHPVEEARDPYGDRQHRPHSQVEVVAALDPDQASRREVRVRAAKRPEYIAGQSV